MHEKKISYEEYRAEVIRRSLLVLNAQKINRRGVRTNTIEDSYKTGLSIGEAVREAVEDTRYWDD